MMVSMDEIREAARQRGVEHIGADVVDRWRAGKLDNMRDRLRRPLIARMVDGMTVHEAAHHLGLDPNGVRAFTNTALRRIYIDGKHD